MTSFVFGLNPLEESRRPAEGRGGASAIACPFTIAFGFVVVELHWSKSKEYQSRKEGEVWGDTWTWTAIDTDTKLCVSYLVGLRDTLNRDEFMQARAARICGRVQITTHGHRVYLDAVEDAFGAGVRYAQPQKIFGAPSEEDQRRFPRTAALAAT